jgi:hypothetical protein
VFLISLFYSYDNGTDSYFFGLLSKSGDQTEYLMFSIIAVGLILLFVSGYLFRTWKECQEPTADEAMALDQRPPILYLRPFQADALALTTLGTRSAANKRQVFGKLGILGFFLSTFLLGYGYGRKRRAEELIVDMLAPLGPVIAIGRPGEKVPEMGASRLYVGDNNWKDVVRDFMSRSQLIVMFGGTTPGFAWEVTEAFRNAPFVPTILLLPYFNRHDEADVKQFVEIFTAGSGLPMPSDLREIRAVYFPSPAESVLIPDLGTEAEKSLHEQNPFLSALGRILHKDDPDWLEKTTRSAKGENSTTKRSMRWIALIPLGLILLYLLIALLNS